MHRTLQFSAGLALSLALVLAIAFAPGNSMAEAADEHKPEPSNTASASGQKHLQPVESSPHEFMEYINQPVYRRLKANLKEQSESKEVWSSITSDALILAEVGNLLVMRPPQENADEWKQMAENLRVAGADLYKSAHEKDYTKVKTDFSQMLNRCNDCHDKFHKGKPNLQP